MTDTQPATGSTMLEAALLWAGRGVAVFPLNWPEGENCSCGKTSCGSKAKHPLVDPALGLVNGLHHATTDPDLIAAWWTKWPHANIGARTGEAFDVIDIDGAEAFPLWEQLKAQHGDPQRIGFALSGRVGGGAHIYCAPGGQDTVPSGKRGLPPGIEIKARGGYVVVAPSRHITGTRYRLLGDYTPDQPTAGVPWPDWYAHVIAPKDQPPAPAPETPAEPTPRGIPGVWGSGFSPPSGPAGNAYGEAVIARAVGIVTASRPGSRWNDLALEAIPLVARAIDGGCADRAPSVARLEDAARSVGPTEAEIKRIGPLVDGMIAAGIRHPIAPRDQPAAAPVWPTVQAATETDWDPPTPLEYPVPPFPTEVFGWLTPAIHGLADRLQVPVDLVGMMTLAVTAATIRGRARVQITAGWDEPLNLYTAIVLGPGETKSPAVAVLTRKLRALEKQARDELAPKIREAEDRHDVAERRLQSARAGAAKKADRYERALADNEVREAREELDAVVVPAEPLWLAGDMTPEALVQKLAEQGGTLAHISAEGSLLDTIVGGRYSSGTGHVTELLTAHDGREPIKVHRRHAADVTVERPCLTLALAVQPHVLRAMGKSEAAMQRGLAARFLYAMPKSLVGTRDMRIAAGPDETSQLFDDLVEGVEELLSTGHPQTYPQGFEDKEDRSLKYLLEDSSLLLLTTYREHLEKRRHPDLGDLAGIGSWVNKLDGQVARLAALLQLIDDCNPSTTGSCPQNPRNDEAPLTVREQALARALILADYLIDHAQEAHVLMGDRARDLEPARQLLGWISDNVGSDAVLRLRDAQQTLRRRTVFREADDVHEAADVLAARGYLRRLPSEGGKPGRPRVEYLVHPDVLRRSR